MQMTGIHAKGKTVEEVKTKLNDDVDLVKKWCDCLWSCLTAPL